MEELVVDLSSNEGIILNLIWTYAGIGAIPLTAASSRNVVLLKFSDGRDSIKSLPTVLDYVFKTLEHQSLLIPSDIALQGTMDSFIDLAYKHNFDILDLESLRILDNYLLNETFLAGYSVTVADLVIFVSVYNWVLRSKQKERLEFGNLMRWFDHIQHLPEIITSIEGFSLISLFDEKLVITKEKKATKTASKKDAEGKKVKKSEVPVETRPYDDVTRLNILVGLVNSIRKHPGADKLYCLKIDIGTEVRSICSGLVEFLEPDQILNKKVCVLANLPPKVLRGEESNGMVLCVSNEDHTVVQLLEPPSDTPVGERISFDGYTGEPDGVLSTKKGKETFYMVQKDFICRDRIGYYKVVSTHNSCLIIERRIPTFVPQRVFAVAHL
ncbi:methionine-tRNA ligase, putative [Theileria equi strain WA]|uniref:Methionine-tRNA ligase, putative n=1 Tax=Theileria equi strain WA TaxID=1537102 RepID=L0AVT8_THEEQ|nr:methionine-tRNA ligase, putative [Theileria equi strain WA]AFZ79004.1 methionine-tRNA ligase, putative [Theileria equi strain WA]|eukprot:XP_004828670.1 methionine-tRNA ligase, putative [Theileria equi strain WA]